MPLKQQSLFDFEAAPAEEKMQADIPVEVQEEVPTVVSEDPVDVDFEAPATNDERSMANEPVPANKKSTRGRKKLTGIEAIADLIEVPEDDILFQKKYYPIGVVAEMFKVNISLLRFWENEFDILKPKKNGKGDRHFRPEDVKNLKMIHHLLREKKYTIEGAKDFLKKNKKADENFAVIEELKRMKLFLTELKLSL